MDKPVKPTDDFRAADSSRTAGTPRRSYTRELLLSFRDRAALQTLPKALESDDFRELQKTPAAGEQTQNLTPKGVQGQSPGFPPKETWRALQVPVRPPGLPATGAPPPAVRSRLVEDGSSAESPSERNQQPPTPTAQPPPLAREPSSSWRRSGSWRREDASVSPPRGGRQAREEADRWSNDAWRSGRGKGGRTGILAERGRGGPPMAQARWEDAPAGALGYDGPAGRKPVPVSNFLSKDRDSAGREGDWRSKSGGVRPAGEMDGSRYEPGTRGVPAWMADGDGAEDASSLDGRRDADDFESQQARLRREIEAERQQYKQQASARGGLASSPVQAKAGDFMTDEDFESMRRDITTDGYPSARSHSAMSQSASEAEVSPEQRASHPPPGLVAVEPSPSAPVVTGSAATRDLRAAFGFDDASDDDVSASESTPPPAKPREDVVFEPTRKSTDSVVGAQRRFHWLQLEASPTRPAPPSDSADGPTPLTLEPATSLDHAQAAEPAFSTRPLPAQAQAAPPSQPHAAALPPGPERLLSPPPPVQPTQPSAPPVGTNKFSFDMLARAVSAAGPPTTHPSSPAPAASLDDVETGRIKSTPPRSQQPSPRSLSPMPKWPSASIPVLAAAGQPVSVPSRPSSAMPDLPSSAASKPLESAGDASQTGWPARGSDGFMARPGVSPWGELMGASHGPSIGPLPSQQPHAILDALKRAQANAQQQQQQQGAPSSAEMLQRLGLDGGLFGRDQASSQPAPNSNSNNNSSSGQSGPSLLSLLQGGLTSLPQGAGAAAFPGTNDKDSLRATLDSAFAAAANQDRIAKGHASSQMEQGLFSQAGGLGSLNLPSHSLQASSLGPQQQPAQQLPHGPQSLLGPAATSRTPGMWGAGQLPMASSHLQGMQPNELRLQQEQLLLQHQAQAAQQQRNRAAGFPQFSGAQIGAPRLAQHAGHPLGGGRLDAGSLPLSQLLNAQNLPLRQDMVQASQLGQAGHGLQAAQLQQYHLQQQQQQQQQQQAGLRLQQAQGLPQRLNAHLGAPDHLGLGLQGAYQTSAAAQGAGREHLAALLQRAGPQYQQQAHAQQGLPAGWGGPINESTLAGLRLHQNPGLDAAMAKQLQEQQLRAAHAAQIRQAQAQHMAARQAAAQAGAGLQGLPQASPHPLQQAPGAAQLPAALAHEQYALGLNRQLLGQGVVGGHPGLPQGLEGVGLSRGFDQLFPPGGARALGGVSAAGGHVPLLPLQGRHGQGPLQ